MTTNSELAADVQDIVALVVSAVISLIVVITLASLPLGLRAALGIGFFAAVTYTSWRLRFLALGAGVYAGMFLVPLALILLTRSVT